MMVFMEKIDPPRPVSLHGEEQVKLLAEQLSDDRWIKNLIDGLSGILRDVRH